MKEWDVKQHEAENSEKCRSQLLLSNKPLNSSLSIQNTAEIIRTSNIQNVKYPNPHFLRSMFQQ
jgi:hypothetical protein